MTWHALDVWNQWPFAAISYQVQYAAQNRRTTITNGFQPEKPKPVAFTYGFRCRIEGSVI